MAGEHMLIANLFLNNYTNGKLKKIASWMRITDNQEFTIKNPAT
jgi:hypothetical protein